MSLLFEKEHRIYFCESLPSLTTLEGFENIQVAPSDKTCGHISERLLASGLTERGQQLALIPSQPCCLSPLQVSILTLTRPLHDFLNSAH